MRTVLVAGALANKPGNGGNAWVPISWVRALEHLGFHVVFVEELSAEGDSLRRGLTWFDEVSSSFGLTGRSAVILGDGITHGLPWTTLAELVDRSRLLVNLSGNLHHPELLGRIPCRAYVDTDPGFTQCWHADGAELGLADHHLHFTVGENIGRPGCRVPTGGIDWRPLRQPVVLDDWPVVAVSAHDRFTTVGSWRGPFGPLELEGRVLGLKAHQFRRFLELPRLATGTFELALAIGPADDTDRRSLLRAGWRLVDLVGAAGAPDAFRSYLQGSGAEFSVAQGIYVDTASGWFSDRTVRYLASGRPALVQDTGFSANLPTGQGLVAFSDLDEAIDGADRIRRNWTTHAEAARTMAEHHFAPRPALTPLLDAAGLGA